MRESTAKLRQLPTVATLVAHGGPAAPRAVHELRFAGPQYSSLNALLEAPTLPDAVVLGGADRSQEQQWLSALRRDARYALRPIFTSSADVDAQALLADGVSIDPADVYRSVAEIDSRLAVLPSVHADGETRLLSYLYSRPTKMIAPLLDWRKERCYCYPLLEAMAPAGLTDLDWVPSLRRRGLIESVKLVDRTRECGACGAAHLNYIDVCPECRDLDIRESIFLHCYACGHVAPQERYLHGDSLRCEKCQARLRHIGVDYDRALETYGCAACGARTSEPEVQARCCHCGKQQPTTELIERRIESFRLSDAGLLAARTGSIGDLFALIDDMNCAHPAYFEQTLDWMLQLQKRHPELQFGLLCIRLENLRELVYRLSRVTAAQLVDSFATRLRELVRTTDLLMRSDDRHCWLLLPQTPPAGVRVLTERIAKLPDLGALPGDAKLEVAVKAVLSSDLGDGVLSAKLLMGEMSAGLE